MNKFKSMNPSSNSSFQSISPISYKKEYKTIKVYQKWGGKNKFFCKGKIYAGSEHYYSILTALFIILNSYFEIYFVCIRFDFLSYRYLLGTIEVFLFLPSLVFELICAYSDPGVIPRNKNIDNENFNKLCFLRISKYFILSGRKYKVRFCKTCHIFRGLGVSHCKKCDNCVQSFDHHCPWIGNCIGKQNYVYFLIFLIILNIQILFNFFSFFLLFFHKCKSIEGSFLDKVKKFAKNEYLSFLIPALSIGLGCFVCVLLFYHLKFTSRNITTYSTLKMAEIFALYGNPFSKGNCKNNVKSRLFKKSKKLVNFLDFEKDEDLSLIQFNFLNSKAKRIISLYPVKEKTNERKNEEFLKIKMKKKNKDNSDKNFKIFENSSSEESDVGGNKNIINIKNK